MAINRITVITGTCDLCKEELDPDQRYIDAGVYGAAFHPGCIDQYGPLIKALGLDDIRDSQNNRYYPTVTVHRPWVDPA